MKKSIKWIIGLAVIGAAIGYYIYADMQAGTPVNTVNVAQGDIRAWVEDRAVTTLPVIHRITMPQDGRILPISIEAGEAVSAGQVVAEMDTADLKSALDLAEAQVNEIQAQIAVNAYDKIENTAMVESEKMIDALNAAAKASNEVVRANQAELKYSKWLVEMEEKLVKQRASSKDKLRRAQRDSGQAESQVASAQFISRATWAFAAVAELMPRYVKEYLGRKHLEAWVLKHRLTGAQADQELAARRLTRAVMKSPVDGLVLRRLIKNEAFLPAGALLLEIGAMQHLQVTADILSQDVVTVQPGNRVDIFGPSIGPTPIRGMVSRIKPAGFTKVSSLGVDQQRVPVLIDFDPDGLAQWQKNGRALGLAYRVKVRIYTEEKQKVLKIPRTALFRGDDSHWQVFSVKNGRAARISVTLGIINDSEAEITGGLNAGDPVVVAPPKSLKAGDRIFAAR